MKNGWLVLVDESFVISLINLSSRYNVDVVAQYLCTNIPIPPRDFSGVPHLIVIRSFDVNRPGEEVQMLR